MKLSFRRHGCHIAIGGHCYRAISPKPHPSSFPGQRSHTKADVLDFYFGELCRESAKAHYVSTGLKHACQVWSGSLTVETWVDLDLLHMMALTFALAQSTTAYALIIKNGIEISHSRFLPAVDHRAGHRSSILA